MVSWSVSTVHYTVHWANISHSLTYDQCGQCPQSVMGKPTSYIINLFAAIHPIQLGVLVLHPNDCIYVQYQLCIEQTCHIYLTTMKAQHVLGQIGCCRHYVSCRNPSGRATCEPSSQASGNRNAATRHSLYSTTFSEHWADQTFSYVLNCEFPVQTAL